MFKKETIHRRTFTPLAIAAAILTIIAPSIIAGAAAKPTVAVGLPPLQWVVEGIMESDVTVIVLVKPGQSPHTFEPSARQVAALSKAHTFLFIGTEIERQAAKRATTQNRLLTIHDVGNLTSDSHHDHPHTTTHCHHGLDPHIWLAPSEMAQIARRCATALHTTFPDKTAIINNGLAQTLARIAALDTQIKTLLDPLAGTSFLVYHPSWGHFATAYGLTQLALEADGKAPTAKHLATIAAQVKTHAIKTLFSNPDAPTAVVRRAAASMGCNVAIIDPLAPSWDTNLLQVARLIAASATPSTEEK